MTDPIPITRTAVWEDEVESVLTDLKNLAENFLLLESSLKVGGFDPGITICVETSLLPCKKGILYLR